ncbi:MAG: DUF4010 domain-containing protein [Rhodospirillales bacterium]|nr:DUF4010 domain-containing protein [Rhodospirillales bacterium]
MELHDLLSRLAVALGIGLLIGLERGWKSREAEAGSRTAGIRTFAISGLLGGLIGALAQAAGGVNAAAGVILAFGFMTYSAVIAAFCREENRADETFSATTAVAAMLTFALGAYALVGDVRIAAAGAVATAGLLAARENLHGWVKHITWPELRSGLVLLAMTFIALPIVPDDPIGPFGGVGPREVWLIAIVLAGVSFVGYAAVKYFGASHGVLLAAAAGGLVSSTAVTATNARRAAAGEGSARLLAAGVSLATAVSFLRVLAIVAVLKPSLLLLTAPALLVAIAVVAGHAVISVYWQDFKDGEQTTVEFRNPFDFWSVVGFAVLLAVIIVIGRALGEGVGATGAIIGAAAMGLADVDAVTVSMARLVPDPLSVQQVTYAILAAVATNMLAKLAIGATVGRGTFAIELAVMSTATILAAALTLWLSVIVFAAA